MTTAAIPLHADREPIQPIDGPSRDRRSSLFPGWPLVLLIAAYPLWWALGLGVLIFVIVAVPMGLYLLRQPRIAVPPGFGIWLLFLVWVLISGTQLGVNPPGTAIDPWTHRAVPFAFRLVQYLSITITVLYIGNLPKSTMSAMRLVRLLALGFVWTVLGGLLGVFVPQLSFSSPLEIFLPGRLSSSVFFQSMFHPQAAQIVDFLGYESARPAAPFGFTNSWGHVYALLIVWFTVAAMATRSIATRIVAAFVVAVSIIPVVQSLNRGLWFSLILVALFLVVRSIAQRRLTVLVPTVLVVLAAAAAVAFTPLSDVVNQRFQHQQSNENRSFTVERALDVTAYSPLLGYGSTRDAIGSGQSIAIGATHSCPRCGNTPLGQNGQLWLLLVSHGIVGAALYTLFFVNMTVRHWRRKHTLSVAGTLTMVMSLYFMLVYDVMNAAYAFVFLCFAVLWRHERDEEEEGQEAQQASGHVALVGAAT